MVLAGHSYVSLLNEIKALSLEEAHIFIYEDVPIPYNNGPLLTLSQIINFIMSFTAELELAALFIDDK